MFMVIKSKTKLTDLIVENATNIIHFRFTEDIYQMTGVRPGLYWQITWRYAGPAILTIILISSIYGMVTKNPEYDAWDATEVNSNIMKIDSLPLTMTHAF